MALETGADEELEVLLVTETEQPLEDDLLDLVEVTDALVEIEPHLLPVHGDLERDPGWGVLELRLQLVVDLPHPLAGFGRVYLSWIELIHQYPSSNDAATKTS